jgi:hypothetical protein
MPAAPRVIHEFEAGRGAIRTSVSQFRGKTFVDVRLWVEPRDQSGADLIPTKRGLSVDAAYLDDLEEEIALARSELGTTSRRAA